MYAYDEMYLDDAMKHLGEMLDYVVYDLQMNLNTFWKMFCLSKAGQQFAIGNPKFNAGMSGVELAMEVLYEKTGEWPLIEQSRNIDCSKEYWAGWALAYYQQNRNMDFKRLAELGIDAESVCDMYVFHEADISKFCEAADTVIEQNIASEENRLKRLRKYAELTQKMLAEKSGVSLRMIQLYEQGQNDLSKAQVNVVIALAKALKCEVEDLVD